MLQSFHLPALPHLQTTHWSYGQRERQLDLRVAQITPVQLTEQVDALLAARARFLAPRPVARVVEALDAVAGRLLDPTDPIRRDAEAALPAVIGASPEMVRRMLDGIGADCRAARLRGLLRADLGEPEVLDHFRPRGRAWGSARAFGPRLATHFLAAGDPSLSVATLVRSLLLKAATLARCAVADPLLPALFARAVHAVDPELGACLAVAYWPAGDLALDRAALDPAEAVTVAGPADVVAAARHRVPAGARFVGYEQRLSFGAVAREAASAAGGERLAALAALDVATLDQRGCSAPHLFYVEAGGELTPPAWAALLARALERLEAELPRGRLSPGEAAAIRQQRAEAESTPGTVLHGPTDGTAWTVIFEPAPAFAASCRNRLVRVKPVAELAEVVDHARPIAASLHTVGVAGPAERLLDLAAALGDLGAGRVAPIGSMAWPPVTAHQGGLPPLAALVRWCDFEGPVTGTG